MNLARRGATAFTRAMAITDNGCPCHLHRDAHFGDIDGEECAAVFTGEHAAGFDRFPAPGIEAKDAIGFRDGKPALYIRELPAMGLTGADLAAIERTAHRRQLFCWKAHYRVITLNAGSRC